MTLVSALLLLLLGSLASYSLLSFLLGQNSKILVPETKQAIKKIQIYVSDSEAAAVVRAKITKNITKKKAELLTEEALLMRRNGGDRYGNC